MLGLYVSDHPLFGLERLIAELSSPSRSPRCSPATVGASSRSPASSPGIQKKFTKTGQPYVVGTIEDLQGGIDVIFFPQTYQQFGELLVEDAILCVSGRLDDGDPPKIIAAEVSAPDVSEATGAPLR
jgi:DNA polymerase III subunit alpha